MLSAGMPWTEAHAYGRASMQGDACEVVVVLGWVVVVTGFVWMLLVVPENVVVSVAFIEVQTMAFCRQVRIVVLGVPLSGKAHAQDWKKAVSPRKDFSASIALRHPCMAYWCI